MKTAWKEAWKAVSKAVTMTCNGASRAAWRLRAGPRGCRSRPQRGCQRWRRWYHCRRQSRWHCGWRPRSPSRGRMRRVPAGRSHCKSCYRVPDTRSAARPGSRGHSPPSSTCARAPASPPPSASAVPHILVAVLKAELARFLGYEKHSSGAKSTCRFVGKHHHPTVPTLCQYERNHQFVWRNSQPAKQLHNPMVTLHQCRSSGA